MVRKNNFGMIDTSAAHLFVDGGVIQINPSPHGGTYGWALVVGGKRVDYGSGVILPPSIGKDKVTNNVSELFAALTALEYVLAEYPDHKGYLWTDSRITWFRLTSSWSFDGIPPAMRQKCLTLRRNGKWQPMHLKGHPSKQDLVRGYTDKGLPVSTHNCFCDEQCQKQSAKFLRSITCEKPRVERSA